MCLLVKKKKKADLQANKRTGGSYKNRQIREKIRQAKPNHCEFFLLIIQATCSLFKICQIIHAHIGAHHTQIDHIFPHIK